MGFRTKCSYVKSCTTPATHYIYTKVGDFPVCAKHAKIAESNKAVRFVKKM
jgi:hypothetical protein